MQVRVLVHVRALTQGPARVGMWVRMLVQRVLMLASGTCASRSSTHTYYGGRCCIHNTNPPPDSSSSPCS